MSQCTGETFKLKIELSRSQYWPYCEKVITPFILSITDDWDITEQEIMRAIGILEVNCYEVKNYVTFGVRGFFPLASLLSHRCVPNSRSVWDQEAPWGNKTLAVTDIKKGDQIFATYIRFVETSNHHVVILHVKEHDVLPDPAEDPV